MNTGSLRARVTLATLALLVVVLALVVAAVTLAYRSSLQRDLRHHLTAAGTAVKEAGSAPAAKELTRGLALEGIATNIGSTSQPLPPGKKLAGRRPAPVKPGMTVSSNGSLLVLDEVLRDGTQVTFSASTRPISHSVRRLLVIELVVALAALALAAVLLFRGTQTALRPLSQVIETASRIAAGDRRLRLRPTRTDTELGSMAVAFDRMVDALEDAVTRAREAEAAMARFLADASHELRTPVAALQASVESLLREQPERPRRDELEAALARNSARLGRLIDDLLSLSRLEGTDRRLHQTVDLAELAEATVEDARLRRAGPTVELDAREARVHGDAAGLQRAVANLLDNALAAVADTGRIEVRTGKNGDAAEVRILDDGPGVPEPERERVFERFVRLDGSQAGTGLGLAIARRIARQHGGDVTCDRVPRGASFTLRIPCAGDWPTDDSCVPTESRGKQYFRPRPKEYEMTGNARTADRILGSLRSAEGKGVVRIEDRFDTRAGDVWPALTDPRRLASWLGEVEGDLRPGGEFRAHFFASGWEGTGRVEVCEPPHRLLVLTRDADEPDEPYNHAIEVTLSADGEQTILAWEERGMPVDLLAAYGAGVQVHVEDLAAYLAGRERCDAAVRFDELFPAYQELAADVG